MEKTVFHNQDEASSHRYIRAEAISIRFDCFLPVNCFDVREIETKTFFTFFLFFLDSYNQALQLIDGMNILFIRALRRAFRLENMQAIATKK